MLTECVNCKFFVSKNDSICPNCGLSEPVVELDGSETIRDMNYLYIGIAAFVVSAFLILIFPFIPPFNIFTIFVVLYLLFWVVVRVSSVEHSRKQISARFKNYGFNEIEKTIQKRLSELGKRGNNIDAVLAKIKETDSQKLQNVRAKLLDAREIIISQFARYELQRQKIMLVRLQNSVTPYLFGWHRLNEFETENGLTTIENTQQEINKIRYKLTNYVAIEFPEKSLSEKQNFLSQLDETETSYEKLREALLSRQAARALQEISPTKENLQLPNVPEATHTSETFNIQTTLTDFSESFNELEYEYKRLKAEQEIGKNQV